MSDATYSRIALHDVGNSTEAEPVQEAKHAPSSESSWANEDLDKPPNARKSRRWNVDYLSNANLMQGAKTVRRATAKAGSTLKSRKGRRKPLRHALALLTFFVFGLLPLVVYFKVLDAPFRAKPVTCGDASQVEEDTPGIEGLFTVDRTAGRFPFWLAKLLDTVWDLVVGRGMQLLAGWVSYVVFCNAMLRALEAAPIPYRTFTGLAMNGASLWTVGCMVRDLGRHGRKRTVLLFAYAAVALVYVLAMPTLFSTMTGYVSVSSPFTKVPGTAQFVPTDSFEPGFTFAGLPGVQDDTCVTRDSVDPKTYQAESKRFTCNSTCLTQFWNGTRKDLTTGEILYPGTDTMQLYRLFDNENCTYFPNETYDGTSTIAASSWTYSSYSPSSLRAMQQLYSPGRSTYNCSAPITLTIANATVPYAAAMNHTVSGLGYCYNATGFDSDAVARNGRCLPDTDSGTAAYQWGFSAMLTSVVLVVHAAWAASLYAVWLEAELRGRADGARLSQLGAAWFAVEAARREGVGAEGPAGVEGMAGRRGAVVGVGLVEDAWGAGARRRGGRGKGEGDGEGA